MRQGESFKKTVPTCLALAAGAVLAISGCAATAQIINAAPQQASPAEQNQRLYHRTQIIVKFAEGADAQAVMAAALAGDRESYRPGAAFDFAEQGTGATLVDLSAAAVQTESTRSRFGVERVGPDGPERTAPLDALSARLNADPNVVYAQKNYLMQPFQSSDLINDIIGGRKAPNDPYLEFQWHLKRNGAAIDAETAPGAVNFPVAWEKHSPKRTIVVAVVDTGQYFDHDDVNGAALLPGYDFIADPFVGADGDGRDADPTDVGDAAAADECFPGSQASDSSWHGSHVAGIAGLAASNNDLGIASPVADGVAFLPVRALGRCGGYTTDLADAVLWAAGIDVPGAPPNPNPALVINASFGGPSAGCDPAFLDALAQLKAKGAELVAAAGNESDDSKYYSPSGCTDAFTVAASDLKGALAPYSNFGDKVDILAPGGDVSADLNGDSYADGILSIVADGYTFYNGTSMAAPLVSAAIALGLRQNPSWSAVDATSRLIASAMPRSGTQCGAPCGAGLMDVAALLDY